MTTYKRLTFAEREEMSRQVAAGYGVRATGGGRKPIALRDPSMMKRLKVLAEASTRGNPMSPRCGRVKAPRPWLGRCPGKGIRSAMVPSGDC
mgnify:CR=1 FL=1